MSDAAFRMLQGQLLQLVDKLGLTWKTCPKNFSSYTEEERERHHHGYGYCKGGIVREGYLDLACEVCQGAGSVLAQKAVDA